MAGRTQAVEDHKVAADWLDAFICQSIADGTVAEFIQEYNVEGKLFVARPK